MQGITPGRVQVLGVAAPVSPAARLPEPWTLSWSDGAWTWAGTGVSAALRGPSHGPLLDAVAGSEVLVEADGPLPPAPWFGGFAFDATAPLDRWWEAFPPAWAFVPRLLLGTDGRSAQLLAFARVGEDGVARGARAGRRAAPAGAGRRSSSAGLERQPPPRRDAAGHPAAGPHRLGRAGLRGARRVRDRASPQGGARPRARARGERPVRRPGRPASACGPWPARRWRYELRADDGTTLLGASPERLFTLEAGRLETQALASSAAPGELDRLTGGHKEAREHAAVVESIRDRAAPALGRGGDRRGTRAARARVRLAPPHARPRAPPARRRRRPRWSARSTPPPRWVERRATRRSPFSGATSGSPAAGTPGPSAGSGPTAPTSGSRFAARSSGARWPGSSPAPAACAGSTAEGEWTETAVKARFMLRAFGVEG